MQARRHATCRRARARLRAFNSLPAISHQPLQSIPPETSLPRPSKKKKAMADRHQQQAAHAHGEGARPGADALLRRVQTHAPNSTQVVGFLTLLVSGAVLLLLTGLTLTGAVVALVFLGPLALLTSPIWVPVAVALFVLAAAAVSACGFVVAALAAGTWIYRYAMGRHPVGADRVDYARSQIANTASHVKDYAREYSGYLNSRSKDAAPGA